MQMTDSSFAAYEYRIPFPLAVHRAPRHSLGVMARRKADPPVMLKRHLVRWRKYPIQIRQALSDGEKRVARIRLEIAKAAKVVSMPPIDIRDEIWRGRGYEKTVSGRASIVHRNGNNCFGVELPATTAVCPDPDLVRLILVHEFAHCFYFMQQVHLHVKSGRADPVSFAGKGDVFGDHQFEEEAMIEPADWFSEEDVEAFAEWHDDRLPAVTQAAATLNLADYLPVLIPNRSMNSKGSIAIPEDVTRHVDSLHRP